MVITGTTGNRVYPKRVPRVQIPPAPPCKSTHLSGWVDFLFAEGFEHYNATVRWTGAYQQLDADNTSIFIFLWK